MTDSYDAASGQIDENKRAMLAAMAQAGTAGVQAYQRAQSDIAAQRQAAVDQALRGAASMNNTPPALMEQMRSTISTPYDRYNADLTAAQAYGQQSNAAAQAANASYFDQAKAAIPALRTYSQAEAAKRQANDAIEQRRLDLASRELDLREQEMSGAGGAGGLIPGLNKQFGGVAGGNRALLAAAKQYVTERGVTWGKKGTTAALEQFDKEAGLPAGYTRALLPKAKSALGPAKITTRQQQVRTLTAVQKRHGADSKTSQVITFITSQASNLAEAMAALDAAPEDVLTTPNGAPLNKTRLRTYLKSYYS